MSGPLVSVGLPVYNGARFLAQALDCLLGQTLADLELIISDNASTDGTAQICLDYAARDSRIRYIRQSTNIGALRNFNFVAEQARGRYFKWASANDFCEPRLLEACVAVLSADPGVVLCHGRACMVDEESGERTPYAGDVSATHAQPSERFTALARSLVLNHPLYGAMRTEVLRRTPLIRPYLGGDLVLIAELGLYGRVHLLPQVLVYRRFGSATWSIRLDRARLQAFLYGGARDRPRFARWHRRMDLFHAVLRAPIPPSEKLRALVLGAQRASLRRVRANAAALTRILRKESNEKQIHRAT